MRKISIVNDHTFNIEHMHKESECSCKAHTNSLVCQQNTVRIITVVSRCGNSNCNSVIVLYVFKHPVVNCNLFFIIGHTVFNDLIDYFSSKLNGFLLIISKV